MTIQCDHVIEARRPDMVVVEKENNKAIIVDMASPWDNRVYEKEGEKTEKYQELKREIGKLWGIRHLEVVPLVEEKVFSLTSSRHLSDLIDVIAKDEMKKVKKGVKGRDVSIILDGTIHVAEALRNIILRFVTEWKVEQQMVWLLLVTKSVNGEELPQPVCRLFLFHQVHLSIM